MVVRKSKKCVQLELVMPTWGGRREGAGRKRASERATVPHVVRPRVREWNPVQITLRLRDGIPSLRGPDAWACFVRALRKFRGSYGLRIVQYSVQSNHVHMIVEAGSAEALARGMQAFMIRLAKALNRCFGRKGPIFAGRYHSRELTTPTEVRNALRYAILNARHHAADEGIELPTDWIDPRSTAAIFDGCREPPCSNKRFSDFGTSRPTRGERHPRTTLARSLSMILIRQISMRP